MADVQAQRPLESPPGQKTGMRIRHLWESDQPLIVTINGGTQLVVQDAASYQKLLEFVDYLDSVEAIREGMKEIEEGKGLSLEEAKESVRQKYG